MSWKRFIVLFMIVSIGTGTVAPPLLQGQENRGFSPENYFASDIAAFLNQDQVNPPPQGGILFIGSSVFRLWTHLKEQMAPLPVFNRAFGGSRTGDILRYMDKIVIPYAPKIVVYYCGSNDINAGESAGPIVQRFRQFSQRVGEESPATRVFYVSINRAPQKRDRWDVVDTANFLVKKFCAEAKNREFIDVNPVLFDEQKKPRYELYLEDQLHLTDRGYEEFAAIIKPVLEKAWNEQ